MTINCRYVRRSSAPLPFDLNLLAMSESILGFLSQHIGNIINVSLVRFINTNDRTLDNILTVVIGGVITLLITRLLSFLQSPMASRTLHNIHRIAFKQNVLNDPFTFHDTEVGEHRIVFQTVMASAKSTPIVWWILHHSKVTASVPARHPLPRLRVNGNISDVHAADHSYNKKSFENLVITVEERFYDCWVPFYKASDGKYVFHNMTGSTGTLQVAIGAETFKGLEELMGLLAKEGLMTLEECASAAVARPRLEINRITPVLKTQIGYASYNRTFDSLFFENKHKYIRMLTAFKDNTLYPAHTGSDNKLGILLHGPPGTGKTHAVVATANFLGMNIASIQMRDVKTCADFDNVLNLPKNANIFVLEEIDCVIGVLRRRDASGQFSGAYDNDEEYKRIFEMYVNTEDKDNKAKLLEEMRQLKIKAADRLTLGYILEKLDGITDESGRIIIATTNHPELLDPALLRPGRLGCHLNLNNCTHQMIVDIIAHYCSVKPERRKELQDMDFPAGVISPAELIQTIQMEGSDVDAVVTHIRTLAATAAKPQAPATAARPIDTK